MKIDWRDERFNLPIFISAAIIWGAIGEWIDETRPAVMWTIIKFIFIIPAGLAVPAFLVWLMTWWSWWRDKDRE